MFLYSDAKRYQGNAHAFIDDTGRALFEIADDKSRFKLDKKTLREGRRSIYALHEVLDHPELFDNYPRLRKSVVILPFGELTWEDVDNQRFHFGQLTMPNRHDSLSESYKSGGVKSLLKNIGQRMAPLDYINVHGREILSTKDLQSTLLHEVQHQIQYRAGAMPKNKKESAYDSLMRSTSLDGKFTPDLVDMLEDPNETHLKNVNVIGRLRRAREVINKAHIVGGWPIYRNVSLAKARNYIGDPKEGVFWNDQYSTGIVRRYHQNQDLRKFGYLNVERVRYFYLPHEIMARETEARVNLTMDERLGIRPQLSATWPTSQHTIGPSRPILGPGSKRVKFFSTEERPDSEANLAKEERVFREVHERDKGTAPSNRFNLLKGRLPSKAAVVTSALVSAAALLLPTAAGKLLEQNETEVPELKIRTAPVATPPKP